MKLKTLITTLAAAVGLTTAAVAKQDENSITPYTWYEFDSLEAGAISSSITIPNSGSCTAAWSVTDGTVVENDGTGKAWQIASNAYYPGTSKNGASVYPTTYIVRINLNGQTFSGDKVVWSCNGKMFNGLCLTVKGNPTDGYTMTVCKHNGSKSTTAITYNVPAEKATGYHWYALTTSANAMSGNSVLYVDGVAVGTSAGSGNWCSGQNTYFGFGNYGNGNKAVATGLIYDDIRMYDQVLTAVQIANIAGVTATTYKATISGEPTWDGIEWDPALEGEPGALDVFEVTGSGTDTVLTFGSEVSYGCKLSLKGDAIKIKADDSIYEDGCWIKEFAKFGTLTYENEPTFADIMEGYKGAYGKTSTGFTLRAQNGEVISINIAGGSSSGDSPSENLVSGSDFYGIAPTIGDSWNNINKQWQGGNQTISIEGPKAYDGTTITNRETMSLSATGKNTWQCGSISNPFLRGYLDDGGGVTVMVHGIPYTSYDVIVYATSDDSSRTLAPITINGTQYTYTNGAVTEGSDTWGVGKCATPEIGKNALRVDDCSGDTLTINATPVGSSRATLCAVQVICTGEVVFKNTYTATISDSTPFENIEWDEGKDFEAGQLNEVTITVDDSSEDEVEISFGNPEMELAKLDIISSRDIKFTADSALSNVGQFIITGCTAKVTYAWPVSALASSDKNEAYAGGTAGDTAVAISHNGGTLNLEGGEYKLSESDNSTETTVNVTDSTLNYGDAIGLGKATYVVGGSSVINTVRFILVQGSDNTAYGDASFTLKDNAAVNVSGTTVADSNKNSVMFGHWAASSTFTIEDNAAFTAEDTQILIGKTGGNHTINVNGGTITAKGIRASGSASGTNTLNLNGGALVLGEVGIVGSKTLAVNVTNDSTITSSAATKITQPITIAADTTLTLDASAGDIVISGAVVCEGTINVVGGNVIFMKETTGIDPTKVTTEGGAAFYGVTVTINDMGTYTPVAPLTTDNVKLYDEAGNLVEFTVVDDHLEFEWKLYGTSCLMEYLFTNSLVSTGTDTGSLEFDGTHCFKGDEFVKEIITNIVEEQEVVTTNYVGIYAASAPWRNVSFPSEVTVVMYGKVMKTDNTCQIGIGSTTGGSQYSLFLASGDVSAEEVKLCYAKGNDCYSTGKFGTLCTMSVPHAQTTDHLYAFTMKKVGDDTVINIYLDGEVLQPYTFDDTTVTLGSGIQLGSIHGGIGSTQNWPDAFGFKRSTSVETDATLKFLRVYDVVLNDTVMREIAKDYPYASPAGSFSRELMGDCSWVETDAWTKVGEETKYAQPDAGSAVTLTPPATDVNLTLNLDADTTYETLTANQGGKVTVTNDAEKTGVVTISGKTTISTDVTVAYDAIKFGNVSIAADKTLTFDFATLDLSKEFASRSIKLTGVATLGEGASVETANITAAAGRTTELVFDTHTSQYSLVITVEDLPFVYNEGWTWNGQEVTAEIVSDLTAIDIVVQSDLEWDIDRDSITVEGGTLKATGANDNGRVTVESGATFDLNGKAEANIRVVLKGGAFVNNGANIGDDKKQLQQVTVVDADSTVGGSSNFGIVAGGWAANTLDLGGKTLTKVGSQEFWLANTTVTNGTIAIPEGQLTPTKYDVTFADDATISIGAKGILHVNGVTLTIGSITAAKGATIDNSGTMSAFTLTGEVKINAAGGTYNAITMADGAVIDIGTRRDLTFAGAGTVNVTLTDDEIAAGAPITLFTTNGVTTTAIGTITYNDADITEQCEKSGNQITSLPSFEATVGTTYYLTLAEALSAAQGKETVTLLKTVTVASLTVPEDVTLDLNNFQVQTTAVVNNGTIVVYDLATATALKDLDGTLKAGADLDATPAMFYPQGTTVAHSTEVVESAEHTNNVPTLTIEVPDAKTVIWAQGVNPYQKMYVTGDAEFAGNISAGWDTNKLQTVFYAYGALKLNSDVNIGKYASASVIGDALDLNGKKFILSDTDAILTTSTNLVAGTDVTTDKDGYEVKMTESEGYYYYTIAESAGKTVAPGGSPVQVTAESEEDAIAQVTLSAKSPDETIVSDEDYTAYFTKKAAPLSGNNWSVYAALKPEIKAAEDETVELASELTAIAGGQTETAIAGAKPGLWYSVEYTGDLQTTEQWTEGERAQAQADGSVTLDTPNEGAATFYTIKVNTADKGTVQ